MRSSFNKAAHLDAGAGVKAAGRFVKQEHLGFVQENAGQTEPLGHAARKACDQGIALVTEIDQLQHLIALFSPFRPLDAVSGGKELQVLDHLHVVVDTEEIGHVAHHAANVLGAVIDRVAAYGRFAPAGIQQRREDAHRRRLAGAVGADEAVDIAFLQLDRQPVEGVQVAIHFGQVAGFDHCLLAGLLVAFGGQRRLVAARHYFRGITGRIARR